MLRYNPKECEVTINGQTYEIDSTATISNFSEDFGDYETPPSSTYDFEFTIDKVVTFDNDGNSIEIVQGAEIYDIIWERLHKYAEDWALENHDNSYDYEGYED